MSDLRYKVELKLNGAWTDITDDVVANTLHCSSGITTNTPSSRVADVGNCNFDLENSIENSAGLRGYYSPGHVNCRAGFRAGIAVRVSFMLYDTTTPKWLGTIYDIDVDFGTTKNQKTHITCFDYIYNLTKHKLNLVEYVTDVRGDEIITQILANMKVQPVSTDFAVGTSTFATGFDSISSSTSAIGEIQAVTVSEFGYCYLKHNRTSDEILVWENRLSRNDRKTISKVSVAPEYNGFLLNDTGGFILNDTGGFLLLTDLKDISLDDSMVDADYAHGENLSNRVIAEFHPKKVGDSVETLFTLNSPIKITAGATITNYKITYRDPNGAATKVCGKDMLTPVAGTDYSMNTERDGTGTDITASLVVSVTFGSEGAVYSFTNNNASDGYISLIARGYGIFDYDTIERIFEDTALQDESGVRELTLDLPYQTDPTLFDALGNIVLNQYKRPESELPSVTFWTKDNDFAQIFIQADCGDRVNLTETQTSISEDYFINGWMFDAYNGGNVKFTWYTKRASLDAQVFCRWDTALNYWDSAFAWGF